jgi:hypothetical protein
VKAAGLIFVAGQGPFNPETGAVVGSTIQEQTRQCLVHYSDDRHLVCGDRGVSEWLLTGTTVDGKEIRVRGCDLFEFDAGRIAKKDSFWKIVG